MASGETTQVSREERMRFTGRAAFFLFLALFLICGCFADDKKTDGKDDSASAASAKDSSVQPPATTAADAPAVAPSSDGAAGQPAPPAAVPRGNSSSGDVGEGTIKWDPMPALDGSPGLFTLETGEVLPRFGVAAAISVNKISRMPGSITVLQTVPAFSIGLTDRLSVFFNLQANDHIHVDTPCQLSLNLGTVSCPSTSPQLFPTIYRSFFPGTGNPAAYVEDYPFAAQSGGGVGEADLGFKVGLLSERKGKPLSLSIREDFYIPTETGFNNLIGNQVQGGAFNFGIGVEASKTVFHHSIVATLNWSYRFVRGESFTVPVGTTTQTELLNRSDQMNVGFGMLMFPGKRINIITEYSGLIYVASGIPNTTFGPRDPVDNVTGVRLYLSKEFALDLGYRYALDLTNHLDRNGFIVKLGGTYWPEKPREPDILNASCSVDKPVVMQGSIVQASASATDSYGHPLTYLWSADAGDMDGSGPYARWNSGSAAPGTHTLTARVDNGAGKTTSCSATVTVQPKPAPPPTMSCSADPSSVLAGARSQVTANVNDSSGTALTYTWQSNGGRVIGTGSSVQLDTSGLSPGNYTVTGRVENGAGKAADCAAGVTVQPPPAAPEATKIGECYFAPNSARVDNVCKRALDDLAIRLQNDPKGKAVLVGFADPKESHAARLAGQRADAAGKFLGTKQGVDRARVDTRSSTGSATVPRENRRLDLVWVPDGATF
jgi:outer membrane protein OmpA-like peptidoglycan-associated protein